MGKSRKRQGQGGCKAAVELLEHGRDLDRKVAEGRWKVWKAVFVNTHPLALAENRCFFLLELEDRQAIVQHIPFLGEMVL